MNEKYWAPAVQNTLSSASIGSTQNQALILPQIGDKILLQVYPYGDVQLFSEGMQMVSGDYIEVEVKAVRKAKVVLE